MFGLFFTRLTRHRSSVLALFSCTALSACASKGGTDLPADDGDAQTSSSSSSGGGAEGGTVGPGADASVPGDAQGGGPGADAKGDTGSPGAADAAGDAPVAAEAGAPGYVCPAGPFAAPILTGLTPAKVAGVPPSDTFNNDNDNFGIIEGPVWIGDSLYVSEIGSGNSPPPARILKVTGAGVVSVAVADSGSNGLATDRDDNLYAAVHETGSIDEFDLTTGMPTLLATGYMGARFDSPNDLTVRSSGDIYFSDPDDQAPATKPQTQTRLYRVAAGTRTVSVIDATLSEPNGVTLSLDESTLYVTSNGGLFRYPVAADGSVGAGTLVTSSVNGDGMAIDCLGNLYVASINSLNILVLNPAGAQIGMISLPAGAVQSVTNVAFGGADHMTLYITGLGNNKGLYQVPMNVPGMPY